MLQLRRHALVLLALCAGIPAFADDALPPELASLHSKAEAGNAVAQYNLGLAYAKGYGVPVDPAEAFVWLSLATEEGSTGKDLGALIAAMSPDALAEGKRRLAIERKNVGVSVPAAKITYEGNNVPVKELPVPTKAPQPVAEAPAPAAPAPAATEPTPLPPQDPALADLTSKNKDLQQSLDQQTTLNQQLSSQLDERNQALLQALSQMATLRKLDDNQETAKAEELSEARKSLEAANQALADSRKDSDSKIAALNASLSDSSSQVEKLSAKLSADESALKASGDTGAEAKSLADNLAKTRSDLAS